VEISSPDSDGIRYQTEREEDSTISRLSLGTFRIHLFVAQALRLRDCVNSVLGATTAEDEPTENHVETESCFSGQRYVWEVTMSKFTCAVGHSFEDGCLAEFCSKASHAKLEHGLTHKSVHITLGALRVTSPFERKKNVEQTVIFASEDATGKFAEITYRQFRDGRLSNEIDAATIPHWVGAEFKRKSRLDGLFEIHLRPTTMLCIRARIEAIMDCVSQFSSILTTRRTLAGNSEDKCSSFCIQLSVDHHAILTPQNGDPEPILALEIGE